MGEHTAAPATLPVAVDAMGGDAAPGPNVDAAKAAVEEGIPVVLVGRPDELGDTGPIEVLPASEVIGMAADPSMSVRSMKDSSLVRVAEAVHDGQASAMVSAGNTGATMASALLKMGRIRGIKRPAIAAPLPCPGRGHPNTLLDAGANVDCQAEWLAQFAVMGAVHARDRWGVETPRVALLSIGEEPSKGSSLVKQSFELLSEPALQAAGGMSFIGNVEGNDLLVDSADVIVTDGFSGNVALKASEGAAKTLIAQLLMAFDSSDEARQGAELLTPALLPLYRTMSPDTVGGAMLLGVRGVCVISHGSSSAGAMLNAIRFAHQMVELDMVGHLGAAVAS